MEPTAITSLVPGQRVVVIQADDSAFIALLSEDRKVWEVEFPAPLITPDYYCFQGLGENPEVRDGDMVYLLPSREAGSDS